MGNIFVAMFLDNGIWWSFVLRKSESDMLQVRVNNQWLNIAVNAKSLGFTGWILWYKLIGDQGWK